jgi:hypothetical protein
MQKNPEAGETAGGEGKPGHSEYPEETGRPGKFLCRGLGETNCRRAELQDGISFKVGLSLKWKPDPQGTPEGRIHESRAGVNLRGGAAGKQHGNGRKP